MTELIRRRAEAFLASVLRKERKSWDGRIVSRCESSRRDNRGDEWTDYRCLLVDQHSGPHQWMED